MTGPVVLPKLHDGRNKTFFLWGYEGIYNVSPRGGILTVPTAEQREGDFSALLRLGQNYPSYDPATRRTAAGGRFASDPLPGNIIPSSRISPISRNLLKYHAAPNSTGTAEFRNNLSLPNLPETLTYYTHTWRADQSVSSQHRVFGRIDLPIHNVELRGRHGQKIRLNVFGKDVYVDSCTNPNDYLYWEFTAREAGDYRVSLTYACDDREAGGEFGIGVAAGEAALARPNWVGSNVKPNVVHISGVVQGTGSPVTFKVLQAGKVRLEKGRNALTIRSLHIPQGSLMKLSAVRLIPEAH